MSEEGKASGLNKSFAERAEAIKIRLLEHLKDVANCLSNDDLLHDYKKKDGMINWKKTRELMRTDLNKQLKEEWEKMWEEEGLDDKFILLQTVSKNTLSTKKAWRPKTGDMKAQKLAIEKKRLVSEIEQMKQIHKEKEMKVASLKVRLTADWADISEVRKRLSQHQRTMDEIQQNMAEELDEHYNEEDFSLESLDEFQRDTHNTTLQGFVDAFL